MTLHDFSDQRVELLYQFTCRPGWDESAAMFVSEDGVLVPGLLRYANADDTDGVITACIGSITQDSVGVVTGDILAGNVLIIRALGDTTGQDNDGGMALSDFGRIRLGLRGFRLQGVIRVRSREMIREAAEAQFEWRRIAKRVYFEVDQVTPAVQDAVVV